MNAEVLSSDFATGLDLLADVLLNPTFPAERTGTRTRSADRRHSARKDDLLKSASVAMRRALVRRHRLRTRLARHGGNRSGKFPVRRLESVSPKTRRAEQLRAGDLRRRESRRGESGGGKSFCRIGRHGRTARSKPQRPTSSTSALQARRRNPRQKAGRARHRFSRHDDGQTKTVTRWN